MYNQTIRIKDPEGISLYNEKQLEVLPDLALIDDIITGERRLIEKSDIYLPQDVAETDSGYESRLTRASLSNYLKKVRDVATSMVLRKPITIKNDQYNFEKFATSDGQSLKTFSKNLVRAAWQEGFALIFVDYPKAEVNSLAEERQTGLRPFFSMIKRQNILDWKTELKTSQVGDEMYYIASLTYLRIKVKGEDGNCAIMEYFSGEGNATWKLWELVEISKLEREWQNTEKGELSISFIPVVPLYFDQEAFFDAELPLLGIANLTQHHFKVSSDLFQILHIIANPKLVLFGVDKEQVDMSCSNNVGLILESPESRIEWVSLTNVNTEPLEKKLEKIEEAILSSVLQIFQPKKQAESGIAKQLDREQNNSLLVLAAEGLEKALNGAFMAASAYTGGAITEVDINKDFFFGVIEPQEIQAIIQLVMSELISQEMALKKLESKGFFDGFDYDLDVELGRIDNDGIPTIDS